MLVPRLGEHARLDLGHTPVPDTAEKRQKVSREGVVLLKSFEGFRSRAEPLDDGRWIIGYGHTLSAREGQTVSEANAELLLQYDLIPVVAAVHDRVTRPLNQHQFDALASFAFSVGVEQFAASDVLAKVNADTPQEAADAIGAWPEVAAPASAALRRRAAERALFVADPATDVTVADLLTAPLPLPLPVAAPAEPASVRPAEAAPEAARAAAVAALLGESPAKAPRDTDEAANAVETLDAVVVNFPGVARVETASEAAAETPEAGPAPAVTDEPDAAEDARPSDEPQGVEAPEAAALPETAAVVDASDEALASEADVAPIVGETAAATDEASEPETPAVETSEAEQTADAAEPETDAVEAPRLGTDTAEPVPSAPNLALAANIQRYSPYSSPIIGPVPGLGQPMLVKATLTSAAATPPLTLPAVASDTVQGAVSQPAPELVLTAPAADDEPVIRPVWDESARVDAAEGQAPLFDQEAPMGAVVSVLRHEAEPAPRRFEWSETGAFLAMGGIGLVSFGAAFAAFRRAGGQSIGGQDTVLIGWVLALIAVVCIGLSGYNLYRRLGRREQD